MRKAALSGAAMNIIIGLISALIALIILWVFHEKLFTFFRDTLLPAIQKMLGRSIICKIFSNKWVQTILSGIGIVLSGLFSGGIGAFITGTALSVGGGFVGLPALVC